MPLLPIKVLRKVTDVENLELTHSVTDEEIHQALLQMNPYRTPGPDGFGPSFFQKYWHILKNHTCSAIREFFHSGKLLKELNHTLIALIPKVVNPETTSQFRPISL